MKYVEKKHFWMALSKMFSIWLAVPSQVEDKPVVGCGRSSDLLSIGGIFKKHLQINQVRRWYRDFSAKQGRLPT